MLPELENTFHELCDAAARETLPRFRSQLAVDNKRPADFDPVTEGDRMAEKAIREILTSKYPEHGIIGEEFGTQNPDADYQWIIDPIDGTRAFISGIPVWGTLIGLYFQNKPVAGVADQPFTRERYMALTDANGENKSVLSHNHGTPIRLQTSQTLDVSLATVMTTSPDLLRNEKDETYFRLEQQTKLVRYGCDCYAYCLLASGHVDLVVESGLNIYDIAALIPIIENAGGIVTNWQGGDASNGGQVLAAANKKLHEQAIQLLQS